MSAKIDAPADGDLVDSFWSNARSLVSIRQPGESDADTPSAALGRMEARVDAGDFAGALEAYDSLPEEVRAAGSDWAGNARARLAADRLVDQVTRRRAEIAQRGAAMRAALKTAFGGSAKCPACRHDPLGRVVGRERP
jgi:hypothetical protein